MVTCEPNGAEGAETELVDDSVTIVDNVADYDRVVAPRSIILKAFSTIN